MSEDRRQTPRKIAAQTISARDINSNHTLGNLVNMNSEGLMLLSPAPIESGLVFQVELQLKIPFQGRGFLHLGIESMWCSNANEPGHYWTGFRIIDVSLSTLELIEALTAHWETEGSLH